LFEPAHFRPIEFRKVACKIPAHKFSSAAVKSNPNTFHESLSRCSRTAGSTTSVLLLRLHFMPSKELTKRFD
jgi:hypothetical protein